MTHLKERLKRINAVLRQKNETLPLLRVALQEVPFETAVFRYDEALGLSAEVLADGRIAVEPTEFLSLAWQLPQDHVADTVEELLQLSKPGGEHVEASSQPGR